LPSETAGFFAAFLVPWVGFGLTWRVDIGDGETAECLYIRTRIGFVRALMMGFGPLQGFLAVTVVTQNRVDAVYVGGVKLK
jgi:hypothetical protein